MPDSKGNPKDNEGIVFVTQRARSWPKAPRPWFNPDAATYLACPRCSNTWMGVIVSDRPFIQLFCPQCGFAWGPMEMHKPQMTDSVAADMGMPTSTKLQAIEEEMDLGKDEVPDEDQ
jgi:hypothetical protein